MRSTVVLAVLVALVLPGGAVAATKTVGADLSRPADNTRTCETGFLDPWLIAGTGYPYTPYATCTWWSAGSINGTANSIVPYGGGTVRRVRVKVGPVTGRMQVVALRLMRHPGSLADPACCFPAASGPVFTPKANGTTELDVDIPVKHETDPGTGIVNYDVLALSVLDAGVPVPATATGDGGWGGIVAGMFPAYEPGTERTVGYGSVMPGHVLLSADVETDDPAPAERPVVPATAPVVPAATTPPGTRAVPPVAPPAAPVTLGATRAAVRKGAVRVPVTCGAARCTGELVLTAATARRGKPVVFGRRRIALAPNATATLTVKLAGKGRAAVRRARTVKALAVVRLGGRPVVSVPVTLTR